MTEMRREFVSFPKSGRSWLRYALTLAGVADKIQFHHDGFEYNDGARPALSFDFAARLQRVATIDRVVYLHRDPRDVMVSLYFQVTGRFKDMFGFRGSISDFIRDPYFGAANLAEFQRQWDIISVDRRLLRVSYEDCHREFNAVLKSIVEYFDFSVTEETLARASQGSSFQNMRRAEESANFEEPWLRPRNGALKVRRGVIGSFRDELEKADILYLNSIFRM